MRLARNQLFRGACLIGVLLVLGSPASAQKPKPAAPPSNPAAPTNPSLPTATGPNNRNSGPFDNTQQIFLTGRVMFDDGSPINRDIAIERVCEGSTRIEGHVDSKGRFSFTLGQQNNAFQDASSTYSTDSTGRPLGGGTSTTGVNSSSSLAGVSTRALMGCELRASYPGYRSDAVSLSNRRSMDDSNVGTLVLHRLGAVQGTTISLTTALAPKDAAKSYQKAMDALSKGKEDVGERQLRKAVEIYPKYAAAWFELGLVEQYSNRLEEARKSYQQAIDADPKFMSPLTRLVALDVQEQKWPDAVETSKKALALNPLEFPDLWYYNAISLYRTGKSDEAVKSAKECMKLDTRHTYPQALLVLASVNANQSDYAAVARNLHDYLELAPDAKNSDAVRKQLATIEQSLATARK